jgi:O-antigen ligase
VRDLQCEGIGNEAFMTMQTTKAPGERSAGWMARAKTVVSLRRRPFVFGAVVVFSGLYYYRPEDFIQPLAYIPMAKVAGLLAFGALLAGIMGGEVRVPRAIKILWALLFQMTLCIPFAIWKAGAFSTVWEKFSKGVIVAMLISMIVVTLGELRKLLWIQLSAVTLVTALSILLRHYNPDGRLAGIQNSILSNPNDLAINIAITFPLGLAFMLRSRGFMRVVWGLGLFFLSLGVVLTASRSGLLALIISITFCVWEYGIKGKRRGLVVATIMIFVIGSGVALSSSHYRARIESIFLGNIEGSGDKGSREARAVLLKKSVMVALTHPLFGVGPGCFVLVDSGWVLAHNAYTEIAAEAGIPALILFLMAIGAAFKNISTVRKSQQYREDPELRLLTQAVGVGLVAYVMGSFFGSTEYNLYPYFMIGYTCALVKIASAPALQDGRDKRPRLEQAWLRQQPKPPVLSSR